jgi:protein with PEP-CTERM/exosortase system signal
MKSAFVLAAAILAPSIALAGATDGVPVPEAGSTILFLGLALVALVFLRRKLPLQHAQPIRIPKR